MNNISNKKNYLLTLFSSFGGQVLSIIINFVSVPIALNYWGQERYGLFAIINSVIVYLTLSNLGLNSAASTLMAKNNNISEKYLILKRSFYMIIISVAVFTVFFIILDKISLNWIYFVGDIPKQFIKETYTALYIMIILFFFNTVLSIIDSVFNGFHKLYIQKNFDIAMNVFSFGALLLTIAINGKLGHFVLFTGLVKVLFSIVKIGYFYYFMQDGKQKVKIEEKMIENEDSEYSYKNIFMTGLRFFFIGIASLVVWNTDNLVISHFLNIGSVTPYSITFKIYNIIITVIIILTSSMLPLLAKEFGNNNWNWINETYDKLLKIMAIFGGLSWIGGILFFKDFINLWTGEKGYAGLLVVAALGGCTYLLSMVNLNAGIVGAFNYINGFAIWIGWLEALVKFSFSVILLKFFGLGGVALGTLLGSLFAPTIFLPYILKKRSLSQMKCDYRYIIKHFLVIIVPSIVLSVLIQQQISNVLIKIGLGIIQIVLYLVLSIKLLPKENTEFFKQEVFRILKIEKKSI